MRVNVIGGGAAGMMAAIAAAEAGARVLVLERMQRVGKKLLATGNGRCNLTNRDPDLKHFHGADARFIETALGRFGLEETLEFFERLGVATRVEDEGKIFPLSGQASSVLDLLRHEMERLGVEIVCEAAVQKIEPRGKGGLTCVLGDGNEFHCDRAILAAGGKSSPNLGSNGGGFKIAQALGHRLIEPFPALTQVRLDMSYLKRLKGLKLEGRAEALVDGKSKRAESGELLFTDYGISGPPILQLSRVVADPVNRGRDITLRMDLFPEESVESLAERIARRTAQNPNKTVEFSLVGFLHKRLIPVVLHEAGVEDLSAPCGVALGAEGAGRVARVLKDWRARCAGVQSWMHSQVTAGGVDAREIDPETMASRIVPGLYCAGEVLDVDGDCGGYNLQWAWSSGRLAGQSAAAARTG